MLRYPASRAWPTAAAVPSSGTWNTPKPSCGIVAPLLSAMPGTVTIECVPSRRIGPDRSFVDSAIGRGRAPKVLPCPRVGGVEGFDRQLGQGDIERRAEGRDRGEERQF